MTLKNGEIYVLISTYFIHLYLYGSVNPLYALYFT